MTDPALIGRSIHEIDDWTEPLEKAGVDSDEVTSVGRWLNGILGVDFTKRR